MRKWITLNTHNKKYPTSKQKKGPPVSKQSLEYPNIELIYTATRLSQLLHTLNNDGPTVREMARGSLLLDLHKGLMWQKEKHVSFDFKKKPNGKVADPRATGFRVHPDWPDVKVLCCSSNIRLSLTHATGGGQGNVSDVLSLTNARGGQVNVSDALITDFYFSAKVTLHHKGTDQRLNSWTCKYEILQHFQTRQSSQWVNLRLEGKLACLQCVDRFHILSYRIQLLTREFEGLSDIRATQGWLIPQHGADSW